MRRIALAAAVILAAVTNLWAQGGGQLPAWNVLGNPSAAASNARSATLNAMFNGAFCSTANALVARVGGSWVCQGLGPGLSFSGGNLTVASGDGAQVVSGRLTLTTATPITLSNVTGATTLFFTPFNGDVITVFDGVSTWVPRQFAEISILATAAQSGATHTNTTIDGLTDTSQLVIGMQVTGTNVAANTVITAIPTGTSVTVNNATTGTATNTMTFKLVPATNYDVFGFDNAGSLKLEWGPAWTNDTTRSTALVSQNGVDVKSGATTRRLLGTVRVTAIAGQLEDSLTHRFVSNRYNEQSRDMVVTESASSWTYTLTPFIQANSNTANQLDYVATVSRPVNAYVSAAASNPNAILSTAGIGLDVVNGNSAQILMPNNGNATITVPVTAYYTGTPGVGRHFLAWINAVNSASGTTTWYGCGGCVGLMSNGIFGSVKN